MDKFKKVNNIIEKEVGEKVVVLKNEAALEAMRQYFKEETTYQEGLCSLYNDPEQEKPMPPDYDVLGLYEHRDEEYYAVILPRDAVIDPSVFLFVTGYIPFMPDVWMSRGKPSLQKVLFDEIASAHDLGTREDKSPLFITGSFEFGIIPAWDLQDKLPVFIEGFKTYRTTFSLLYEDGKSEEDGGRYCVYVPSEEFRILTGIHCSPELLSKKLTWEKWEKRPYHIPEADIMEMIDKRGLDKDLYQKALNLLNESMKADKGNPALYSQMETRLRRYERLLGLSAPLEILEKEQALLKRSLKSLT